MPPNPRVSLPRSTPGAQGVDPGAVLAFCEEADLTLHDLHSLMLVRHGHVVAEGWWAPYGPRRPHMLFSLSKSFTSTAAGLAIQEGKLSPDAPVLSFFPQEAPQSPEANLKAMQVRHLLMMGTGHDKDTTGALLARQDGDWARAFLELPVEHAPGTKFVYNSGATYMVSAIVQRVTGKTVRDYLKPRLFEPLGVSQPTWETCPRGVNPGGWGLSVKTEDIARFGMLYLGRGEFCGQRIVAESWVTEATSRQILNGDSPESDWAQGYGFQFWRCRHGAYRGDGAFGQFCVVMPEQDAVLVTTAGLGDMQAVLNLAWKHLLPAMHASPLNSDKGVERVLQNRLARLALRGPEGKARSSHAESASGKTYRFAPNDQKLEAITCDFIKGRTTLRIQADGQEHKIVCGERTAWVQGRTEFDSVGLSTSPKEKAVAARGAWTAEDTYTAHLCFVETPFTPTLTLKFSGERMTYHYRANVAFGPTERASLEGRLEA